VFFRLAGRVPALHDHLRVGCTFNKAGEPFNLNNAPAGWGWILLVLRGIGIRAHFRFDALNLLQPFTFGMEKLPNLAGLFDATEIEDGSFFGLGGQI
jgi:hypothetical protein